MPNYKFSSASQVFKCWEIFLPEKLNQKCCRILLSVHRKTSRLAILGDLARYPVFIKALLSMLNYDWVLGNRLGDNSWSSLAYLEMQEIAGRGQDCWLSRVNLVKSCLGVPTHPRHLSYASVSSRNKFSLQSKFQIFWKDQISAVSLGPDGRDHNKLRFFKTFKSSFTREKYLDDIKNRNQRCWLSRLRLGAHRLEFEMGRWNKIPPDRRFCKYCHFSGSTPQIGDEQHFLLGCNTFRLKRQCFLGRLKSILPHSAMLSNQQLLATILCPPNARVAKLSNKFIKILFKSRDKLDDGTPLNQLGFMPPGFNLAVDNLNETTDSQDYSLEDIDPSELNVSNSNL